MESAYQLVKDNYDKNLYSKIHNKGKLNLFPSADRCNRVYNVSALQSVVLGSNPAQARNCFFLYKFSFHLFKFTVPKILVVASDLLTDET